MIMKKIFFNDKLGLTQAVLDGRKTMARQIIPFTFREDKMHLSRYKAGEIYAIAQSYETIFHAGNCPNDFFVDSSTINKKYCGAGFKNKLFVRADAMPHHIRIINVKIERLQDIDDESCMKEGIGKYFLGFDSPHTDCMGFTYSFDDSGKYKYPNAKQAFVALIYKLLGKCIYESNPFMFVYEFELID